MNIFSFKKWGIKARVLTLAIFPVVLIAVLMSYHTVSARIADSNRYLNQRGLALVKHLAPASEFGLYSGNKGALQALLNSAVQDSDVQEIHIYDMDKNVVVQAKGKDKTTKGHQGWQSNVADNLFQFREPVYESGINVIDYELDLFGSEAGKLENRQLGWVLVKMSPHSALTEQRQILINSISLVIMGLVLSVFLALLVGNSVVRPIMNLSQGEKRLRSGDYLVRVEESSGGELGTLESGFNALAGALHEATQELHQQVTKATEALTETVAELEKRNIELDSARKVALIASQAKADFLAKMSHEIRTPMNAVLGFTRLLHKTNQSPDQWEYTRTIKRAAVQLLTVIDDVLNFSRLESGTIELESVPFELVGVLEDVVSMLSATAHDKQLELVLLVHSDVPDVIVGDPARLSQILTNLLNNAIKFTEMGSVIVQAELSSPKNQSPQRLLKMSVQDTGVGIDVANQESLFKEFSQADSSITRKFGGTGLGLTIARRFVEMMGGELGVESARNKGSKFWFTLPIETKSDVVSKGSMLSDAGEGSARQNTLFEKNVLIYDSHSYSRRTLRNNLLFLGANVYVARDQNQVRDIISLQKGAIDLLVLGLSNEELSIEEAVRPPKSENIYEQSNETDSFVLQVRKLFGGPILLLAGRSGDQLPESKLYSGEVACLSKPVRRDRIRRVIGHLLGKTTYAPVSFAAGTTPEDFSGLRVLVVEDNQFNQELITTLLQGEGVDVTLVGDGVNAVNMALKHSFDIILMDIHLPGIDGVEAVRRIRQLCDINKHTPVVALTADVFADSEQKLAEMGFDDVLLKPIIEEKLWSIFSRFNIDESADLNYSVAQYPVANNQKAGDLLPGVNKEKLVAELYRQMDLIQSASKECNHNELREQVHQMKGLAGYFGVKEIEAFILDLEQLVTKREYIQVENLIEDIRRFLLNKGKG